MPKNWACSLNFSCHISHFWLIWLVLLREVFSCERFLFRVRIWNRLPLVVTVVRFLVNAVTQSFIRTKNKNTTDFSSSIGNRNCYISFYYWEIWDRGSNFSQEIRKAKLLASIATAPKVRWILILLKMKITFSWNLHYLHC